MCDFVNMNLFKKCAKYILPKFIWRILREIKFHFQCHVFENELKKRAKLSPADYIELSKDLRLVTKEYGYNAFYGLADIVKKREGLPMDKPLHGAVEHGFYPLSHISEVDETPDEIWVMSEARARFLRDRFPKKKIHPIGMYIQYVGGIYDDASIKKIKQNNGRTLLVFPPHATPHSTVKFFANKFIEEIKRIKEKYNFDTVYVNMYWREIELGEEKKYIDAGFNICTAGHMYEPLFLSRLKTIIELSDMTMGCVIGTHIGYCVALGKSHYFYRIDPEYLGLTPSSEWPEEWKKSYYYFIQKVEDNFSQYHEKLTEENKNFIRYYWGDF